MAYNQISLPGWQNYARRVFGLTGQGGNVPQVAPELQPVVIMQPDNAEFRRFRGEALWAGGPSSIGIAANYASAGYVNPTGSGVVAVFSLLEARFGVDANQLVNILLDLQANVESRVPNLSFAFGPRDTRVITPGAGVSGVQPRSGPSNVALGGFVLATTTALFSANPSQQNLTVHDVVLFPGFGVMAATAGLGTGVRLSLSAEWYERALTPEEEKG